jgi:hypothetical protein
LVIESGIPVPYVYKFYTPGQRYRSGDMVMFNGSPYEALGNTDSDPSDVTSWKRLGYDDRVRLCLSYYTHSSDTGTPGTGGRVNHPYILQFDGSGDFIMETVCNPTAYSNIFYDPFNVSGALTPGRVAAKGGVWSTDVLGADWSQAAMDVGGFVYPPTGRAYQLAPVGMANGNVGVTYRSVGSRTMGVIFRWSNASNFWIATQTGLFKVVAGASLANPASGALSWPTFVDGDRMTVTLNGNSITVSKNGTPLGTATDSFNAIATRHGVEAEA